MEIFTEFNNKQDLSLALGFFDGVHLGHKAVISKAVNFAKDNNLKSAVVTFKDSPVSVLKKISPKYLLTSKEKFKAIENLGVDYLYVLDFTEDFAKITADEYLKNLVNNLHPKAITTGYNHYFGYNKTGGTDFLHLMQEKYGYKFNEVKSISVKSGVVSSSRIRSALQEARINDANLMLGYRFFIENEVIKGQQIGRTLGFKTANLLFPKNIIDIPNGVYAVEILIDDLKYMGIANYGTKPTVSKLDDKILEVHILDFDKDIYGKTVRVNFLNKIRDEQKFQSLVELRTQIEKDIKCLES